MEHGIDASNRNRSSVIASLFLVTAHPRLLCTAIFHLVYRKLRSVSVVVGRYVSWRWFGSLWNWYEIVHNCSNDRKNDGKSNEIMTGTYLVSGFSTKAFIPSAWAATYLFENKLFYYLNVSTTTISYHRYSQCCRVSMLGSN